MDRRTGDSLPFKDPDPFPPFKGYAEELKVIGMSEELGVGGLLKGGPNLRIFPF